MLLRVVPRLVSGHKVGLRGDGELLADYCLRTLPPFFRNLHGLTARSNTIGPLIAAFVHRRRLYISLADYAEISKYLL